MIKASFLSLRRYNFQCWSTLCVSDTKFRLNNIELFGGSLRLVYVARKDPFSIHDRADGNVHRQHTPENTIGSGVTRADWKIAGP